MDRSKEQVDDAKNNQCTRGCRSRSTSRNTQLDIPNNTKSKLSNFTNNLLKRNVPHNSPKLNVPSLKKNELSKSTEDCRKARKGFFDKVKISDIFATQKQGSPALNGRAKRTEIVSTVTDKNINCDRSPSVLRTNGNVTPRTLRKSLLKSEPVKNGPLTNGSVQKGSLQNVSPKTGSLPKRSTQNGSLQNISSNKGSLLNGSIKSRLPKSDASKLDVMKSKFPKDTNVSKPENSGQPKPRGRIVSYLRFFENSDSNGRFKEPYTERSGSLKITKNEKSKVHQNCDQPESERFFKIGRFMRRKSSADGKKSPELTENNNSFVSHIPQYFRNFSERFKDGLSENATETDSILESNNILNSEPPAAISDKTNSHLCEDSHNLQVLPDIIGFSLCVESRNTNDMLPKEDSESPTINHQDLLHAKQDNYDDASTTYNTEGNVSLCKFTFFGNLFFFAHLTLSLLLLYSNFRFSFFDCKKRVR